MNILFKNELDKVLVEYDSYISDQEITATKELLEYENNCKVSVFETKGDK